MRCCTKPTLLPRAAGSLQRPGLVALCATLMLALLGCDNSGGTSASSSSSAKPAKLVVSGDTAGWLMPCGCTSNQSGGLLRRGTYVNGLRATSDVILADAGGAAGGDSEYHKV